MALTHAVSRGLQCNQCRSWILRSFIASIGGTTPIQSPPQRRTFSRSITRRDRNIQRARQATNVGLDSTAGSSRNLQENRHEAFASDPSQTANEPSLEDGPSTPAGHEAMAEIDAEIEAEAQQQKQDADVTVTHTPWYLRDQPSIPTENPILARQRFPDLPFNPPPLLQPILSHISVDLGLDSLSLLDLRQLDPPPALGANLLMAIGTARSEKHLHVSADRLCRWLRTEYQLRPYADGLLGRNELKLKMKRKAKRARLMSAVGSKPTGEGELDDGIRTGWVCVNVGRVEGGELPEEEGKLQRAEGVVGFGAVSKGCNIVVQMLTEEKRGEIDLEKLWTGIMNRARRDKAKGEEEDGVLGKQEGAGEERLAAAAG